MRLEPVVFRRNQREPPIELCGQTTLFPADLPALFGDQAGQLPRLCRAEISTLAEPSTSVYFAPMPLGAEESEAMECSPILLACSILFRYLTARQESPFEDIPREVDCCFKDTCGFPIVHASLVGQNAGGIDFKGVIHRRLHAAEEFAVRFSSDELRMLRA